MLEQYMVTNILDLLTSRNGHKSLKFCRAE